MPVESLTNDFPLARQTISLIAAGRFFRNRHGENALLKRGQKVMFTEVFRVSQLQLVLKLYAFDISIYEHNQLFDFRGGFRGDFRG